MPGFGRYQQGAYILTPQKTLARQYMDDFGDMGLVELKGRSNYRCAKWSELSGEAMSCEDGAVLNDGGVEPEQCSPCAYRMDKDRFCASPFGTTNFSYYLHETRYSGQLMDRNVLILDEGHNTEDQILSLTDTTIDKKKCKEYGITCPLPLFDPGESDEVLGWLDRVFVPAASAYLFTQQKNMRSASDAKERVRYAKKASAADNFLTRVNMFRNASTPSDWFVWSDKESGSLMIKPLTARQFANDFLFSKAQKVLIMSATILDFETFMRNLGIDRSTADTLSVDSEFPLDNRPIFYRPVGDMRYQDIDKTLPKMAKAVEGLLVQYHKHKGIIHTNSYKINRYLLEYLNSRGFGNRIVTHDSTKGSREAAVALHAESPDPTVLMSPSMTEGLDLHDELARFGITCKVPYPSLDPYTKARMNRDPDWYQWKTALKLVQGTGRINRHRTDKAHNYILDAGFTKFFMMNNRRLSEWWTKSIVF